MKAVYEDEELIVKSTGHDYDFIATLEIDEESDYTQEYHSGDALVVVFTGDFEWLEPIKVPAADWVGLLADEEGYAALEAIEKRQFYTIWEDDYEES